MIRKNPRGDAPVIPESAYIDETAIICGRVELGENVFVGPYAVIRADEMDADGGIQPIVIGDNTNIQDGVVIHNRAGTSVRIGRNSSIAHRAIVHGPCEIGDDVFIGFSAVLYDCTVGRGAAIRHNAVVENCRIPRDRLVPPAVTIQSDSCVEGLARVDRDMTAFSEGVVRSNLELIRGYKRLLDGS